MLIRWKLRRMQSWLARLTLLIPLHASAQDDPEAIPEEPATEQVAPLPPAPSAGHVAEIEPIPGPAPECSDPICADTLVNAGGVSLGSYMAGRTYYLTLQRHHVFGPNGRPWKVVTGTSAGSINSFLAAVAACKPAEAADPAQSIFYRTWVPLGLEELANPDDATARSLLSARAVRRRAEEIEAYLVGEPWTPGIECNTSIGVVATRADARQTALPVEVDGDGAPSVARQTEKFVFELKTLPGQAPSFFTFDPPPPDEKGFSAPQNWPILGPLPHYGKPLYFQHIRALLQASASFPLAFPPTTLGYSLPTQGQFTSEFIDGAVFENVPVRLAQSIRSLKGVAGPIVVIDTDAKSWHNAQAGRCDAEKGNMLAWVQSLAGQLTGSLMGTEIANAFETDKGLRRYTRYLSRNSPTAGENFFSFGAFLHEEFRKFDFFLGMVDADFDSPADKKFEPPVPAAGSEDPWSLYRCGRDWAAASQGFMRWPGASITACADFGRWDPHERIWKEPAHPNDNTKNGYNFVRLLAAAQELKSMQMDPGVHPTTKDWWTLMKRHGVDEAVRRDPSKLLRDRVEPALYASAAKQDTWSSAWIMRAAGRIGFNYLDYRDPRWTFGGGLSPVRGFDTFFTVRGKGGHGLGVINETTDIDLAGDYRSLSNRSYLRWMFPSFGWLPATTFETGVGLGYGFGVNQDTNRRWVAPSGQLAFAATLFSRLVINANFEGVSWVHEIAGEHGPERWWRFYGSVGWRWFWDGQ